MYGSVMVAPALPRSGRLRGTKLALVGVGIDLALAAGLGAIRTAGGSVGMRHAEGPLPTLAMVAAFAAPGVLALIGLAIRRPVLVGAAGFACAPVMFVSIVAFPMLIPGVLLLRAYYQASAATRPPRFVTGFILGGFLVPILVGLWILITQTAQFTYSSGTGSEGGDYFTPAHGAFCIALIVADMAAASFLAWRCTPRA